MVRMAGRGRGENWLLIKKKDRYASPESANASSNGKASAR